MSSYKTKGHVVTVCQSSWGHNKPLCALLSRMLRIRPFYATMLATEKMRPQLLAEFDRLFGHGEDELKKLIRVVGVASAPKPLDSGLFETSMIKVYQDLYSSRPVPPTPESETPYEAVQQPSLVIIDFFCTRALQGIRATSERKVPVYAWQSGSTTSIIYLAGPKELGGPGEFLNKALTLRAQIEDEEVRRKEMRKLFYRCDGEVAKLPGLPEMYGYEMFPQQFNYALSDEDMVIFQGQFFHFFKDCEGVIMTTSESYEGPAIHCWRKWFEERPVIDVGAVSPPASSEEIARERKNPVGAKVEAFLDDMLQKHGPNSVIYISFGTIFWPAEPEKLWTVVNELLDQNIPFIMSHASPFAVFPEDVLKRIDSSGVTFHDKWLPQPIILRHKALGWAMTHCGHNSVCEALTNGVPLICWPFAADQPINATLLTWVHNVAYELFEVRTGLGLKPILRLGEKAIKGTTDALKDELRSVLKAARSYDGDLKRSKAQWFAKQFAAELGEGGEQYESLKKILSILA